MRAERRDRRSISGTNKQQPTSYINVESVMTPPRHSLWLVRLRILLAAVTPGRSLFKSGVAFNLAVPIVLSPSICRPFAPRAPRTSYLPCDHLGSHLLWVALGYRDYMLSAEKKPCRWNPTSAYVIPTQRRAIVLGSGSVVWGTFSRLTMRLSLYTHSARIKLEAGRSSE